MPGVQPPGANASASSDSGRAAPACVASAPGARAAAVRDRIVRAATAYAGTPTGGLVRGGTACAASLNVVLRRVFGHRFGRDPARVPSVREGLLASGEWRRAARPAPGDVAVQNGTHLSRRPDDPYENHIGFVVRGPGGALQTLSNGDHALRHGTAAGFAHLDDVNYDGLGEAARRRGPSAFYRYVGPGAE